MREWGRDFLRCYKMAVCFRRRCCLDEPGGCRCVGKQKVHWRSITPRSATSCNLRSTLTLCGNPGARDASVSLSQRQSNLVWQVGGRTCEMHLYTDLHGVQLLMEANRAGRHGHQLWIYFTVSPFYLLYLESGIFIH